MRKLDPKVATQEELLSPYLQLGQTDLAYQVIDEALERDRKSWLHNLGMSDAWLAETAAFRKDARFGKFAQRVGLVDYWKQYGYPDQCHPGSANEPVVCTS